MDEQSGSLVKTVQVDLFGTKYDVRFPNVGQTMEIEAMKMGLTNNKYDKMLFTKTKSSIRNLTLVDAVSVFTVMVPDLKKQLDAPITEMEMYMAIHLIKAYENDYYPWFKELDEAIDDELDKLLDQGKNDDEPTGE